MTQVTSDVVIVGSGAGGGTAAQALAPLVAQGHRVLVLEQGPRLRAAEFTGRELDMAEVLYEDGGGFLTADGSMTLAFGRVFGGSTVVYTGTSLIAPDRVIRRWAVLGLDAADLATRSRRYMEQNNVHYLTDDLLNDNNRLFREGAAQAGYHCEQFPLNLSGCLGSSLCNLGCPNLAKQGVHRVQLPAAERAGVEVVTRAEVLRIEDTGAAKRRVHVRVHERRPGEKGDESEWRPGDYTVNASVVVAAGGAVGSSALLLRSGLQQRLPRLGAGFTCHPAFILVAEHAHPITNDVGHPKSFFVDRAEAERFVLETCMYFPFTTAKNLTGFGAEHSALMRAFTRLQMILVLACDRSTPDNRITVDRAGKAIVHYRFTPEVIRAMTAATRASAKVFFGAGAVRVHAPLAQPHIIERSERERLDELIRDEFFQAGATSVSAAHLMGGCGMGRSAADSVTDGWGRVHGMPWLRVADASLFPDALEINPYLTVMALADRAAQAVLEDAGALFDAAGNAALAGTRMTENDVVA